MEHVFFLSYASVNVDPDLEAFIDDLRGEVAPNTTWSKSDPHVCFRDRQNLKPMDEWEPKLVEALQTSTILVSLTSPAYFNSRFCGKEYQLFDQRRRQGLAAGASAPSVILPVIWTPVSGMPISEIHFQPPDMPASVRQIYERRGLRYLRSKDHAAYLDYVRELGVTIVEAWRDQSAAPISALPGVTSLEHIPNKFAGGRWEEAVGPNGWLTGSGVVTFVFAAGDAKTLEFAAAAQAPERYGAIAAEWKPFFPPKLDTVSEMAYAAAKRHELKYREIPIDRDFERELRDARLRQNLTVVLVDPHSLSTDCSKVAAAFDGLAWDGAAVLVPMDETEAPWDGLAGEATRKAFPVMSKVGVPAFHAPVSAAQDLSDRLDDALQGLLAKVTAAGAASKAKTDAGPSQISAAA